MQPFAYNENGQLSIEELEIAPLARQHGTPLYLYSRQAIEQNWLQFDGAARFNHRCCYAVKANPNLAILNLLAKLGAGFDIVSGGELARVLEAGGSADKVIFSGTGKSREEIDYALDAGIGCFNVESTQELTRIAERAAHKQQTAPVTLRLNPDIDAETHPYITTGKKHNKFGIPNNELESLIQLCLEHPHLELRGLSCHIGSQLTSVSPFIHAFETLLQLYDELASEGIELPWLNLGGGLGVRYHKETPPAPAEYMQAIAERLGERRVKIIFEPGRSIVANAGLLIARVEYIKNNGLQNFAITNAAMNDLLRPALYQAYQPIIPLSRDNDSPLATYDVVGPICESGDFLGKDRELSITQDDLLAICGSGAYGFSMSSNYNSRCRAAEVMVDGQQSHLIRAREQQSDLWRGESMLP
ncbi:diaminopimelate decarboxylase [Dongshaea marina]|uniref:diaminopimelate decarboxylase n=1 Tax=Dongshaea marina TaxID=2047966 RepID=UPI000D3E6058|nr:diaminopimelate decarboxylase [Dongshaea marina]